MRTDFRTGVSTADSRYLKMRLAQGSRDGYVYDDFDRSDRTLFNDICPTGQTWVVSGPGQNEVAISNGKITCTTNYYASLNFGRAITRISGTYSWNTGAGTDQTAQNMTLIAQKDTNLTDMLHLNFSSVKWTLMKRIGGGSFTSIGSREGMNLLTNGAIYTMSMDIDVATNTVTVTDGNGVVTTITDSDISNIAPTWATYQYTGDSTGYKGYWHSVTVGKSIAQQLRAEGQGANMCDLNLFYGYLFTYRQKITGTVTGAGWYRIAGPGTTTSFNISGNVRITAQSPYGSIFWDVNVSTFYNDGVTPKLTQNYCSFNLDQVSQLRLSRNDSTFEIGLDMYVKYGGWATTYTIEFLGDFVPVRSPVVGATALPTVSNTIVADRTNTWVVDKIGGNNNGIILNAGGTNQSLALNPSGTGGVGISVASPSARLHLVAGSATASTAPLKFTAGTDLTVIEAGALEYSTNLLKLRGDGFGVLSDSYKMWFGAGSDMTIWYDGTNGNIKTSDVAASDLRIQCGTDKTVVLDETVWDDFPPNPIIAAKLGSSAPTLATFVTDIEQYTFDATNDYVIGSTEIPHTWKEGTAIIPHIHWATNGTDGTDRGVKWQLKYTVGDFGEAFSSQQTITVDATIPASTADRTHYVSNFTTNIDGANLKIGAYICWRLNRIATAHANGAPTADPFGLAIGFHGEMDTMGSRGTTSK